MKKFYGVDHREAQESNCRGGGSTEMHTGMSRGPN